MKFGRSNKPKNAAKKELSPQARQLAVSLVINSLLVMFVYYGALELNIPLIAQIVTVAYMAIFGGFLVAYIAYNRAFSRKDVTPDMLPDEWTDEQKLDYINDGKVRAEKSRWMLSVIIPFLVTFIADTLYLFVWTGFLENFFK